MLTVGELKALLEMYQKKTNENEPIKSTDFTEDKYVYGLRGIRELFKVSHATAQKYKDGILKEAVKQYGKKIIVDKKHALKLFAEKGGGYEKR